MNSTHTHTQHIVNYVKIHFPKVYHYLLKMAVYDYRMEKIFMSEDTAIQLLLNYNSEISRVQNGQVKYADASVPVKDYIKMYNKYVKYSYEMALGIGRDVALNYIDIVEKHIQIQVHLVGQKLNRTTQTQTH